MRFASMSWCIGTYRSIGLFFALGCLFAKAAFACDPVEGTYVLKNQFAPDNRIEVVRDGKQYRYALEAFSAAEKNDGSKTRSGTSNGTFSLKDHVAHIKDKENACRFVFSFKKEQAVQVRQIGSCLTFGYAVDATGNYAKN